MCGTTGPCRRVSKRPVRTGLPGRTEPAVHQGGVLCYLFRVWLPEPPQGLVSRAYLGPAGDFQGRAGTGSS